MRTGPAQIDAAVWSALRQAPAPLRMLAARCGLAVEPVAKALLRLEDRGLVAGEGMPRVYRVVAEPIPGFARVRVEGRRWSEELVADESYPDGGELRLYVRGERVGDLGATLARLGVEASLVLEEQAAAAGIAWDGDELSAELAEAGRVAAAARAAVSVWRDRERGW